MSSTNAWHNYAPIIKNIKDFLDRDWNVDVLHTLREGNACTNHLTKIAARGTLRLVDLASPPPSLDFHLLANASGVEFLRM